jgi:hypothetical protein
VLPELNWFFVKPKASELIFKGAGKRPQGHAIAWGGAMDGGGLVLFVAVQLELSTRLSCFKMFYKCFKMF